MKIYELSFDMARQIWTTRCAELDLYRAAAHAQNFVPRYDSQEIYCVQLLIRFILLCLSGI